MNDDRVLERRIASVYDEAAPSREPAGLLDDVLLTTSRSRQRPEWLALIKEPPMRSNSRLAVGSPTVRVAAIMAATLLIAAALAGAGLAGSRLLAANAAIIVDQSGDGDFTTITAAVAAAEDGDTIAIRPGRYVEGVAVVGKDLTIEGDGNRDEVVIEAASTMSPVAFTTPGFFGQQVSLDEPYPWAILLADTNTRLAGLTVVGQHDGTAIPIVGAGAAPVLERIVVRVGEPISTESYVGESVTWTEGASGTLRDSVVEGNVNLGDGTDVTIVENEMPATCISVLGQASQVEIRGNAIHGCLTELGIAVNAGSSTLIEGNDLMVEDVDVPIDVWRSLGRIGIEVSGEGPGSVTIRDNDIHDSRFGIQVKDGIPTLEITGNHLHDNDMGIARIVGAAEITDNIITGSLQIGLELRDGAPNIDGNTITDNLVGLSLIDGSAPVLSGNTICDNDTNVKLPEGVSLPGAPVNEICTDVDAAD